MLLGLHPWPAQEAYGPRGMLALAHRGVILLDAGAHTDVRDGFLKSTPLGWACRWGRMELVTLLLARGVDPIEPGAEPWATPLAWPQRRQQAGIASILRQHGSDR
jgi:hypothetical protein